VRCWRPESKVLAQCAAFLLTAAATGLLAVGCGGNEKRDFRVDRLNPLTERLAEERSTLAQTLRVAHPRRERDAAVLRSRLDAVAATMRRIAALRPPDGTEERFVSYTRANEALLGSLNRYIRTFTRGTAAEQRAAAEDAQTAARRADAAESALQHALQ
jgi:hypothetical protein